MEPPQRPPRPGEGEVASLSLEPGSDRLPLERPPTVVERGGDLPLEGVEELPGGGPRIGGKGTKRVEERRDRTLAAEEPDPQRL